jgi:sRNA-binding protein
MNYQPFGKYRYDREERENVVRMLEDHYPKCFSTDPRLRRPLKRNIAADLQADGFPVAADLTLAAVEWYESHYGYHVQVAQAGAKRIDLRGVEVGTVTELEAMNAQKRIREINEAKNAKRAQQSPITVLSKMHASGLIPDCAVKKLDAPLPARRPSPAPEFAAIYDALNAGSDALAAVSDPDIRGVLIKAVLDMIVRKARQEAT